MVIMHPYEVAWAIYVHDSTRKCGISLFVWSPVFIRRERRGVRSRRDILPEQIMEEWPKCLEIVASSREKG
jgi:hypothetical protein